MIRKPSTTCLPASAIFRMVIADAVFQGLTAAVILQLPAVEPDRAGIVATDAGDGAHELRLSLTVQRADAQDLAPAQFKADVKEVAAVAQILNGEQRFGRAPLVLVREDVLQFATDHHPDDLILGGFLQIDGADQRAVLEHGGAIAEAEHVLHAMGNEDDRLSHSLDDLNDVV